MTIKGKIPGRIQSAVVSALVAGGTLVTGCAGGERVVPAPAGVASLPLVQAAKGSVVRIIASGCKAAGLQASGWIADPGLVVSAADFLAGAQHIQVYAAGNGPSRPATVVAFDTSTDVAVLRVAGLAGKPLPLRSPIPSAWGRGTLAALLGYPSGAFESESAVVGTAEPVKVPDAYGHWVTRSILTFTAYGPAGFAGGPLLDPDGQVIAMDIGGVGDVRVAVPDLPIKQALSGFHGPDSTGACP